MQVFCYSELGGVMLDFIFQNFHILLSGVAFIVWLVRLEGLVRGQQREIDLIEKRQNTAIEQVHEALKKIVLTQEQNAEKLHNLQIDVAKIVAFEEGRKSVNSRKSSGG